MTCETSFRANVACYPPGYCCKCDRELDDDEGYLLGAGNNWYCEECYLDAECYPRGWRCCECDRELDDDEGYCVAGDNRYCELCYVEIYDTCYHCGTPIEHPYITRSPMRLIRYAAPAALRISDDMKPMACTACMLKDIDDLLKGE